MRSPSPGIAATVLAAVLLLAIGPGCAPGDRGPDRPIAIEQVLPATSLDVAAVRVAARAFVRAYADAATDRALALERVVVGRELTRWVRWLGIQNAQFEGSILGRAEVTEVLFIGVALGETYDVARVRLRATVTFEYAPEGAEPFSLERVLDGPMLLVRVGPQDWRVADVTRDGTTLSEGIRDLGRTRIRADGVHLVVDSAFVFPIGWQVNVTVENRTATEIRLESVRLATGDASIEGRATAPLRTIPGATGAIGILAFSAVEDPTGAVIELRYRTAEGTASLAVPIGDLLGAAAPSPSPSSSA